MNLEKIARYLENYDPYTFTDAYGSIEECVKDLQTFTREELIEMLKETL